MPRSHIPLALTIAFQVLFAASLADNAHAATSKAFRCGPVAPTPTRDLSVALSGGGYRAMLFHVGSLWRLNELGCLSRTRVFSGVSGGSIVAGILAVNWNDLEFDANGISTNFREKVADPIIAIAQITIDWPAVITNLIPGVSAAKNLEATYAKRLFGGKKLTDIPDFPEFRFNASNLQTGQVWIFSKFKTGDRTTGYTSLAPISIAAAVAASSAYPPVLSLYEVDAKVLNWNSSASANTALGPFREHVLLTDGGILDNLGLESIWDEKGTFLVSDGGGSISPDPNPETGIVSQTKRVIDMIHSQHDVLRTRILMKQFEARNPDGVYWSIREAYSHCDVPVQGIAKKDITALARIETRLSALDEQTVRRLINWGYLSVDRALPFKNDWWDGVWSYSSDSYPFPDAAITLEPYRTVRCRNVH